MYSDRFLTTLSLRTKVLSLLSLIFVFLVAFSILNAISEFHRIKQEKQLTLRWVAKWIESDNHRHIAQARQVAFSVTNHYRKGMTDQVCREGVVGEPGLDPEFGHIAIADTQGNISCNSIPWLTDKNVSGTDYFKNAINLVDSSFIHEVENNNSAKYVAVLARAMRDNGHAQGVVLVAMEFSWINEEIESAMLAEDSHILVVGENGRVIAGSKNVTNAVDKKISHTPFYMQVAASKTPYFDGLGFDGKPSMILSHPFSTGSGDMLVIIDVPNKSLLKPIYLDLARNILIGVTTIFLITMLAYYWIERYVLGRINRIERATRNIADGDLSTRIEMPGNDELGRLAQTFDLMADSLQAREREITAAQDQLYRVNRALKVLSAGNKSLIFATTEEELLERICRDIVDVGGYLAAWIGFTGQEGDAYLYPAASYTRSEDEHHHLAWKQAGKGLETVIAAVREDRVIVVNDTQHGSVHPQLSEQAANLGYRSMIVLPLHLEGKPVGVLILCAHRENEFDGMQVEYLKETASDTSFGIEMLRTKGEKNRLALLGEHHEQMLRESLEETLNAISTTIEMRDPYTAGHQRRVADLAKSIAIELNLNNEEVHAIYLAAIVHDIGKINIPAEILTRPGKLDLLEYKLIQHHVTASYEILKGIKFPWPIADMVHQHHERVNGSGYPLGLADGEILYGARIMAVADVIEAMTSHRPYRAGLGIDVALKEIETGKGTLYDNAAAEAAIRLFREGRYKLTTSI